ncbi:IS66 family insertion sequence element accessory protein TnpB [Bradyrhizobium sp. RDT10]
MPIQNGAESSGAADERISSTKEISASPTRACGVIEIELSGAPSGRAGCGTGDAFDGASGHPVIALRSDLKVVLAAQPVNFRKSVHTPSALVSEALRANPHCGDVFVFRGTRMDRGKLLAWDGGGMVCW